MKITVIGHICKDVIHGPKGADDTSAGDQQESWGGIVFSLLTLANLAEKKGSITPVFGVGEADYEPLMEMLAAHPSINTKGIYSFPGPTNLVHLFYEKNGGTRTECSKHISEPIPFSRIEPYLEADGILINMVSGFDISLQTLDSVRMAVRDAATPIHFDFHSLTLGIGKDEQRFSRPVTDWRRWCFMMNSVQLSEAEARGLTSEQYDETMLVNQLMPLLVNTLIITRGERGLSLVMRDHKKLKRTDIPGIRQESYVDATGSGDVFGAAFLYSFLKSGSVEGAAEFANSIAAFNTTFMGSGGLNNLDSHLASGPATAIRT